MTLRRKKTNQKGYTLVEAMVVLVIIGIIASIAIGGLTMYRRYASFKKNNEYAQTLFAASQAVLSHAKGSGQLEELREALKTQEEGSGKLTQDMIKNGADFEKRAADGGLYFLCYKMGEDAAGDAHKLLYDLLEPYVYDATILDATFCIEFDAVDGTVLGVLYSDMAKDFSYDGGSTTDAKATVHISDRDQKARKEVLLGYYGVERVSARAPQKTDKAFIKEIKLVNDETLHAEWTVDTAKSNISADAMQFAIQICRTDEAGNEQIIAEFTINDSTQDENKLQSQNGSGYVKSDVWFYDDNGKKADAAISYRFPAYIDENQNMMLALDAVDTAAGEILAQNSLDGILKTADAELYQKTYSIRRFTNQPENLRVKIQAYATGTYEATASAWTLSNEENAYFAKAQEDTAANNQTFEIANARHLFNVRYMEKAQETKSEGAANYEYSQIADINWAGAGGIVANENVYTEMTKRIYSDDNMTAFPAIVSLANGNIYHGNDKTIESLYVTAEEGPLGLFGVNRGTIRNLTMKDCVITGEKASYVGSFCGVNAGTLNSLTATGGKGAVTGGNYVGGIAGSDGYGYVTADGFREAENKRDYQKLTNTTTITGKQVADEEAVESSSLNQPNKNIALASNFVGGIIGYVNGIYVSNNTEAYDISVFDLENSGNVVSEFSRKDGKSFVGGIAGYAQNAKFFDCSVSGGEISGTGYNDGNGNTAAYTGGVLGYLANGDVNTCQLTGNGLVTVVWGNLGGIVGKNDTGGFVGNCVTDMGWNIIAEEYLDNTGTGGIIGYNASSEWISSNDNEAYVEKNNKSAIDVVATGGIIGRQESKEPFVITGCYNKGDVSAYTGTGGIVGRIKGAGGTVEFCENAGSIYTKKVNGTSTEGAGGIVGTIYNINSGQTIQIIECKNYGLIQGMYGGNAGIVAGVTGGTGNLFSQILIEDCVNTGKCESSQDTKKNAGILAVTDVNREILIRNCRNYGTGNGTICGIASNVQPATKLYGNFGVASCGIPIAPHNSSANVTGDNYYFSNLIERKESIVQTVKYKDVLITTEGKNAAVQSNNPIENLIDGSLNTRCSYEIKNSQTESTIEMIFEEPQELKTLDIYWYDQQDSGSDGLPRRYSYTLSYLEIDTVNNEDVKPLFTEDGTEEGELKVFQGVGYKNTYIKNGDTIDMTDSLARDRKVNGIVITIQRHSHTNRFVSLFEIAVNDDSTSGIVYEAEENLDTKGTPLGVTKNGVPYHAMNSDKRLVVKNMLMNPLEVATACPADYCENAYQILEGKLQVTSGILSDAEIGKTTKSDRTLLESALDTIAGWGDKLMDVVNPDEEKKEEEQIPDDEEETGEETLDFESVETDSGENAEPDKQPVPEPEETTQPPEKQEPLRLTETVLADSDIPQTAVAWDEEEYVGNYDLVLQADQNEAYHYRLIKNQEGSETPYLIMHETDKTDANGDVIWEEMPPRVDDKYPKTEVLSSQTTVTTYYYPLGYSRIIDGVTTEEREVIRMVPSENAEGEEPQTVETTTMETVEVPCQTTVEAYLACIVYTKPDGTVSRQLYLVFPDIETIEGVQKVNGTENAYRYTYDLTITNQVTDAALYEAPAAMHWWREMDGSGNWITKIREAGKENE